MAANASISISKSNCSDGYFDNVCSRCLKKNNRTEGDRYCMECQEYYCSKCVAIHQDFSALSNHTLIGKSDSKFKELIGSFKPVPAERCHQHNTELVDMYCTVHKKVGCKVCMNLEHTICENDCNDTRGQHDEIHTVATKKVLEILEK